MESRQIAEEPEIGCAERNNLLVSQDRSDTDVHGQSLNIRIQTPIEQVPAPSEGFTPVAGIEEPFQARNICWGRRQSWLREQDRKQDIPVCHGRRTCRVGPALNREPVDEKWHLSAHLLVFCG